MSLQLPNFKIQPEAIVPTLQDHLASNRQKLSELLDQKAPPSWENTVEPLMTLEQTLSDWWAPIAHLQHVQTTPALRQAYHQGLECLSEYETDLGQNQPLYERLQCLASSLEAAQYTKAQKTLLEQTLRDFKLSGVALPPLEQSDFKALQSALSSLQSTFADHLMDATESWTYWTTDPEEIRGIPENTLLLAAQGARRQEKEGWLLTLDQPCYQAVMGYATHRPLRQRFYEAYAQRASELGTATWNNQPILAQILRKRAQSARLLGFSRYTELSLVDKMVQNPQAVFQFLESLVDQVKNQARQDYRLLEVFIKQNSPIQQVAPWDLAYYSEQLKKSLYALDDEMLRPYFPLPRVLEGLLQVLQQVFGIALAPLEEQPDLWHPDVLVYGWWEKGVCLGVLYLDLYARAHKQEGAWMDEGRAYRKTRDSVHRPIAFLTCNFQPPAEQRPALLTHEEVLTLFHEMGHCIHHLVTEVPYPPVGGISGVPWDAVEFPSQFLEHWCWQPESLDRLSAHYQTQEPLPSALKEPLLNSRYFQSSLILLRQLEFSIFDFQVHTEDPTHPDFSAQAVFERVRERLSPGPCYELSRFPCQFSHIFSGGYDAGYYSYLWAEILASDAFSAFEEQGIWNVALGQRFRACILARGGSEPPLQLFKSFRGRGPHMSPFLRHRGISTPAHK